MRRRTLWIAASVTAVLVAAAWGADAVAASRLDGALTAASARSDGHVVLERTGGPALVDLARHRVPVVAQIDQAGLQSRVRCAAAGAADAPAGAELTMSGSSLTLRTDVTLEGRTVPVHVGLDVEVGAHALLVTPTTVDVGAVRLPVSTVRRLLPTDARARAALAQRRIAVPAGTRLQHADITDGRLVIEAEVSQDTTPGRLSAAC